MYLVRHAPSTANDPGRLKVRGWLNTPVDDSGRDIAKERAQVFMDTPIQEILYSPVERSEVMAGAVQLYTGAPIRPDFRLMSWNMGDYQGQALTERVKKELDDYMLRRPQAMIPGGESYMMFLSRLLPYMREVADQDEVVCVTHYRDFCAVAAWDAAGRDGLMVDPEVLKDSAQYDRLVVAELTPTAFTPMVFADGVAAAGGGS